MTDQCTGRDIGSGIGVGIAIVDFSVSNTPRGNLGQMLSRSIAMPIADGIADVSFAPRRSALKYDRRATDNGNVAIGAERAFVAVVAHTGANVSCSVQMRSREPRGETYRHLVARRFAHGVEQ